MTYSEKAIQKLTGIEEGDYLKVKTIEYELEGILLPSLELNETDFVKIKINSGYNLGIDCRKAEFSLVRKKKEQTIQPKKYKVNKIEGLNKIGLITTGGTISSKVDYTTGGVKALMKPEEYVESNKDLMEIAEIESIRMPFNRMSEDLNPSHWSIIAKEVAELLNSGLHGIIVTHGTDTLHYTSAALSFALGNLRKPVAVVGAQKSADRGSFDGFLNLTCAARYAASNYSGVKLIMHYTNSDDYCQLIHGCKARKMHSSARNAFRSINEKPQALINKEEFKVLSEDLKENYESTPTELFDKFEEKVGLVKIHPGFNPSILQAYSNYKGIIIEGTGLGHVPTNGELSLIPEIKRLVESGVLVGITTQCIYGTVNDRVYSNLRILKNTGAIFCEDMHSETAFVKLSWVLANTNSIQEAETQMKENLRGEFSRGLNEEWML
ncbi:Glutamyl-tRNA(Gln) amidotransferase subunit D [uncultured archaeon]|nr:Glutamyl-tRNA(Gln) amidotransferase subunit D [uncultured archaeon]